MVKSSSTEDEAYHTQPIRKGCKRRLKESHGAGGQELKKEEV